MFERLLFGAGSTGDEPPGQLSGARARRERFAAAKAQLDAAADQARAAHEQRLVERAAKEQTRGKKLRGRKPKPPADESQAKANTSDPDSRIMKTKDGYGQGYNAQAVATKDQIVVAAEVTDEHNDQAQPHPMIAATNQALAEAGIDEWPQRLLADAGYCSELLLDEPTNDLDVETLQSLENALLEFSDCVVVTSHDRWLLDRVATHILAWEGDEEDPARWFWFEGNFASYEENKIERLGVEATRAAHEQRRLTRD